MAATIPVTARVQRNLVGTLEQAARAAGLSLETYTGQILDSAAAEFRSLRIVPSCVFTARDDDDLDEEELRKPRAQEQAVCRAYRSGLRGPEIAERFGISAPTVYRILVRGIPSYEKQIHHRRKAAQNAQNKNRQGSTAND